MFKIYTKVTAGNSSAYREGYDMRVSVISKGTRINVGVGKKAIKEFHGIKHFSIGVDTDLKRIYLIPDVFDGYTLQIDRSGNTGHFEAGNQEMVRVIKRIFGNKKYITGKLQNDENGYYIEVPE